MGGTSAANLLDGNWIQATRPFPMRQGKRGTCTSCEVAARNSRRWTVYLYWYPCGRPSLPHPQSLGEASSPVVRVDNVKELSQFPSAPAARAWDQFAEQSQFFGTDTAMNCGSGTEHRWLMGWRIEEKFGWVGGWISAMQRG